MFVTDDIESEAKQGLVVNRTKGILQVSAIKGQELGRCKRAIIGRHKSVIIDADGKKDEFGARKQIKFPGERLIQFGSSNGEC